MIQALNDTYGAKWMTPASTHPTQNRVNKTGESFDEAFKTHLQEYPV
jgi:hypothetical protein